uniref:Ig-like domain-containing protein n=1 Tax=Chrysemys picta bellii TaxID=8478 RepID=A0A8C3F900_CHRPI
YKIWGLCTARQHYHALLNHARLINCSEREPGLWGRIGGWKPGFLDSISALQREIYFQTHLGPQTLAGHWTRDGDQTVYHSDETRVHAAFKGRARFLGDLQHNCSLRVAGLRPSDQGTYRFQFEVVRNGRSERWTSKAGQQLSVSGNQLPSRTSGSLSLSHTHIYFCLSLKSKWLEQGSRPSLTCSVGATCPYRPSWYDGDGARRSPEQTPGRAGATELRISPSQLDPGAALRCQVDGYRDEYAPTGVRVTAAPGTSPQEGESVTLTCSYTSSLPAPTSYAWYWGDRQLEGSLWEMVLKGIAAEQAGEYHCQANNGIGQSPSPPITITVRCKCRGCVKRDLRGGGGAGVGPLCRRPSAGGSSG